MLNSLIAWLIQYKSIALFFLLALGIVGLPIPDETLMTFAGVLIAKNQLPLIPTMVAAYAGSLFGITLSYFIGRSAGTYLIKRYGKHIGLTQTNLNRAHHWFEKIGKWTLLVGYFIPGVRHLTGYVAGTTELSFSQFAIFAYTGALLWCSLFLTLGYFSSQHVEHILAFLIENLEHFILLLGLIGIFSFMAHWLYKTKKKQ